MIKEVLICLFLLPLLSFAADDNPQKMIVIKQRSMSEGKVSGTHVFNVKIEIQNLSATTTFKEILLDVALYNKNNDIVASKLTAARWDKMKPFVKRSFMGKIKNTFDKLSTEETPRKKMENSNALRPSETKEFDILFSDEDFKASEAEDKSPVSYSVKYHSAKIIPQK
jgi:hypothetical protein